MNERIIASAKQKLARFLEKNNHRNTPERYAILDAVYSFKGHFTFDELNEKLSEDCHFPVSRATLYNTLRLFLELRLIVRHKFQTSTKYEAYWDDDNHCHLICTVCGKVTEIKSPEITSAVRHLPMDNFHRDGYSLYIYGICADCQKEVQQTDKQEYKILK